MVSQGSFRLQVDVDESDELDKTSLHLNQEKLRAFSAQKKLKAAVYALIGLNRLQYNGELPLLAEEEDPEEKQSTNEKEKQEQVEEPSVDEIEEVEPLSVDETEKVDINEEVETPALGEAGETEVAKIPTAETKVEKEDEAPFAGGDGS